MDDCFNPYFIGLPILILVKIIKEGMPFQIVSILILLDYLFLLVDLGNMLKSLERSLNPYFIGLPILISWYDIISFILVDECFNPYFIGLPILIVVFPNAIGKSGLSFNPYFIGLPILIRSWKKSCYSRY